MAGKGVRLLTEFTRPKTDDHVEGGEVLRPSSLTPSKYLHQREVLKIFVIGDNVDHVVRGLEVVAPSLEGLEDG